MALFPKPRAGAMASVALGLAVDAKRLPVAACSTPANPAESHLIQQLFGFMIAQSTPARVIGDKAYDSDRLDELLAAQGLEMIAPNRLNRSQTQDGRALRRSKRRWTVERTIAWLQNYRRLCIRWENLISPSKVSFTWPCALLLIKEVLG